MAAAGAATAAMAVFLFGGFHRPRACRGKGGEFFVQLAGTAMRALGAAPVGRAHKAFAVAPALFAMKLVEWHEGNIVEIQGNTRRQRFPVRQNPTSEKLNQAIES